MRRHLLRTGGGPTSSWAWTTAAAVPPVLLQHLQRTTFSGRCVSAWYLRTPDLPLLFRRLHPKQNIRVYVPNTMPWMSTNWQTHNSHWWRRQLRWYWYKCCIGSTRLGHPGSPTAPLTRSVHQYRPRLLSLHISRLQRGSYSWWWFWDPVAVFSVHTTMV